MLEDHLAARRDLLLVQLLLQLSVLIVVLLLLRPLLRELVRLLLLLLLLQRAQLAWSGTRGRGVSAACRRGVRVP